MGNKSNDIRVILDGHTYDIILEANDIYDPDDDWKPADSAGWGYWSESLKHYLRDVSDCRYDDKLEGYVIDYITWGILRYSITEILNYYSLIRDTSGFEVRALISDGDRITEANFGSGWKDLICMRKTMAGRTEDVRQS